jgi:hypothetical protein
MPDESGGGGVPDERLLLLGAVVLAVGREVGRTGPIIRATEAKD